ncbi:MAG TPA: AAA family ATPase, partial [Chloroflexota bacterium]|nr:AAA family ATPase [Chloroflexota bacterium]
MASIIAVANQKGGVGKTTTTANLGTGLARRGFSVLLVDLDPQANLTAAFGLERDLSESIATCLISREVDVPILRIEDVAGVTVDVVPSSLDVAAVESALVNKLGRELRLREQLGRVQSQYDYILIDT